VRASPNVDLQNVHDHTIVFRRTRSPRSKPTAMLPVHADRRVVEASTYEGVTTTWCPQSAKFDRLVSKKWTSSQHVLRLLQKIQKYHHNGCYHRHACFALLVQEHDRRVLNFSPSACATTGPCCDAAAALVVMVNSLFLYT
jgi:hypothetical protein